MILGEYLQTIGPGRRSECTLIEQHLVPSDKELELLAPRWPKIQEHLLGRLQSLIGGSGEDIFRQVTQTSEPLAILAGLFNQSALALQRRAGHRVSESGYVPDSAGQGVWAWFEYEHDGVGYHASRLAIRLLLDAAPELQLEDGEIETGSSLEESIPRFVEFARPLVLPLDAEAIIGAATRRDIPCFKLERDPYPGVQGDFRIRLNGLLMLGHCANRQIVDGTLSLSRNPQLAGLIRDREALRERLLVLNAPLPGRNPDAGNCVMARRAIRAAEGIGYPVVVKPGSRACSEGVSLNLGTADAVRVAVDSARRYSNQVIVEAMVDGESHKLLMVAQKPMALVSKDGLLPLSSVHESILRLAGDIASSLDSGLMALDIVTSDIARPLAQSGGAIVDLDLAPELDKILPVESELHRQLIEEFVLWLYPEGSITRVPILTVTGTNGKTTTCHMISRVLQEAGHFPAMACSDGVFFNGQFSASRNDLGHAAHHHVFENPQVDTVVFEEYFGRIARAGFSFTWCDVAVCTNVTADHLGRIGTHTLDEMAAVKEALPQRARYGVVLNADDARCLAMASRVTARKIGLVSMQQSAEELGSLLPALSCACVIETQDDEEWLVLHDTGQRTPLVPVRQIPATFNGAAEHNTSNAMHAVLACYLAGVELDAIAEGLSGFRMSFESTPGRLNVFDELPFRVIMDYAHNMDGYNRLCSFVDQQEVSGKKILMFGLSGDRQDKDILEAAGQLAGHFDNYVCRNFRFTRGREPGEVPGLLKAGLQSAGVPEQAISTVADHQEALQRTLDQAQPGDLVVLLVGAKEFTGVWEMLRSEAGLQTRPE